MNLITTGQSLAKEEMIIFEHGTGIIDYSNVTNAQVFRNCNLNGSYKVLASPEGAAANQLGKQLLMV